MRLALALCFALSAASISACVVGEDEEEDLLIAGEGQDGLEEVALDEPEMGDTTDLEEAGEVVTIAAGAAPVAPGCVAKGTLGGRTTWLHFTRPLNNACIPGAKGRDLNILKELKRLIDSVPAGGRIDGHIFSISVPWVAKALLEAQQRGVRVWISADGKMADATNKAKTDFLDKLDHRVYCKGSNHACISTAPNGISHTKLFTFSTATAPDGTVADDVVWFGSANQTYSSGMAVSNNTVTVYGATELYGKLRNYLDDLYTRKRTADYYDPGSGRGHLLAGPADVYVSPESQTDLIINRLDDIVPDENCRIRVMQASFRASRTNVIDQLAKLKRGGCKVYVVSGGVSSAALRKLHSAGIKPHDTRVHDKAIIVHAKFRGGAAGYENIVYTGSHNLSSGAAHRFDEIFVKLAAERDDNRPVYDAYVRHFNDAYSIGPAR
jgi:hypothetical protein